MAESFDVFITAFDLFGKIHEKKACNYFTFGVL